MNNVRRFFFALMHTGVLFAAGVGLGTMIRPRPSPPITFNLDTPPACVDVRSI